MTIKFHPTTTICISPWCINYINEFVYIPLEFHINIEWSIYISIYWYEIYLSTLHVIQTVLLKITANKSEREKRWINVLLTKQRRQKRKIKQSVANFQKNQEQNNTKLQYFKRYNTAAKCGGSKRMKKITVILWSFATFPFS